MCGIFGVISREPVRLEVLERAQSLQSHRGPDARRIERLQFGHWHLGLAHQRLAIIDLSEAGTQPMMSPSGRSLIVYNGEVYNYLELRDELQARGVQFRTRTDTEVIAAACEEYGATGALSRMNGMWAFAWIDLAKRRIVLGRDRFGVKPLYLWQEASCIAFASEIKTLLGALRLRCPVNHRVVSRYLRSLHLDTDEETFFEGIVKVPAGHYAEFDAMGSVTELAVQRYWSLPANEPVPQTEARAIVETRELLHDAVRIRLRSDVPVGVLLSGGLDSSSIAAIAARARNSSADLALISAVSDDPDADESRFIHAVARHIGHTVSEVRLSFPAREIVPLIGRVTAQNDEPLGGFSCVAQYLLMARARELGVTVLLSGQGADEAFCGYRKYTAFYLQRLARQRAWWAVAGLMWGILRHRTLLRGFRLAEARRYLPGWAAPRMGDIGGPALAELGSDIAFQANGGDVRARQRVDFESLSVPALTHWEDRNSMAWSREVRNPFLDYRLVTLGVSLPMSLKLSGGWTKFVVRRAVEDLLPRSIVWRPDKRGFSTPEAQLMRSEIASEIEALLGPSSEMARRSLVDPDAARARFATFLRSRGAGQAVGSRDIFQLISLELWLRAYLENLAG